MLLSHVKVVRYGKYLVLYFHLITNFEREYNMNPIVGWSLGGLIRWSVVG